MSARYGDIQSLQAVITTEARQDAAQITAETRSRIASIERQARERSNVQCSAILEQAREKAKTLRSQAVTSAQLEAQALKLERREALLARVMDEARRKLADVPGWPDYGQIVRQLIHQAAGVLGGESLVILADDKTRRVLDKRTLSGLAQELGVQLELGETLERGTGVILVSADGHRRYDNTLETRLGRMLATLRTPVYRILMGETL
jgi:vacuolar-type H+-ATPase subunit E/Vma4